MYTYFACVPFSCLQLSGIEKIGTLVFHSSLRSPVSLLSFYLERVASLREKPTLCKYSAQTKNEIHQHPKTEILFVQFFILDYQRTLYVQLAFIIQQNPRALLTAFMRVGIKFNIIVKQLSGNMFHSLRRIKKWNIAHS